MRYSLVAEASRWLMSVVTDRHLSSVSIPRPPRNCSVHQLTNVRSWPRRDILDYHCCLIVLAFWPRSSIWRHLVVFLSLSQPTSLLCYSSSIVAGKTTFRYLSILKPESEDRHLCLFSFCLRLTQPFAFGTVDLVGNGDLLARIRLLPTVPSALYCVKKAPPNHFLFVYFSFFRKVVVGKEKRCKPERRWFIFQSLWPSSYCILYPSLLADNINVKTIMRPRTLAIY